MCPFHSQNSLNNPLSPFRNISCMSTMPMSRFLQTLGTCQFTHRHIHSAGMPPLGFIPQGLLSSILHPHPQYPPEANTTDQYQQSHCFMSLHFFKKKKSTRRLVPAWVSLLPPYTCRQMLFHTSGSQPWPLTQASESTLRLVTLPPWW